MGVVYEAMDQKLDRRVALKVLPADKACDREYLRRLTREAKSASSLNHPNIVTVYDVVADDATPFIVMEYVRGTTLAQLIPPQGMRTGDALKIAVQIADALAVAAKGRIIHRDVKPGNVMVTETGLVKVLDFGIAKITPAITAPSDATIAASGVVNIVLDTGVTQTQQQTVEAPFSAR